MMKKPEGKVSTGSGDWICRLPTADVPSVEDGGLRFSLEKERGMGRGPMGEEQFTKTKVPCERHKEKRVDLAKTEVPARQQARTVSR